MSYRRRQQDEIELKTLDNNNCSHNEHSSLLNRKRYQSPFPTPQSSMASIMIYSIFVLVAPILVYFSLAYYILPWLKIFFYADLIAALGAICTANCALLVYVIRAGVEEKKWDEQETIEVMRRMLNEPVNRKTNFKDDFINKEDGDEDETLTQTGKIKRF